ncbi:MAG TPA: polymer-forming cytoskeletal protein [Blastocatellia bacterium]|jgi:cytoskeletal protein CcmA (bactofilin family)|nr:polymer-forming cytoskeletal protein [Blastocatellia bacterium]
MKLVKNETNNSDFGWIGRGIEVSGDIRFNERIQVDGKVTGKMNSESGTLIIGESGHMEAEVQVGICVVHGTLYGDLMAKSRVEIRKTGKVNGDVFTPVLIVEEGAAFNGAIKMGQDAASRLTGEIRPEEADIEGKRKIRGA